MVFAFAAVAALTLYQSRWSTNLLRHGYSHAALELHFEAAALAPGTSVVEWIDVVPMKRERAVGVVAREIQVLHFLRVDRGRLPRTSPVRASALVRGPTRELSRLQESVTNGAQLRVTLLRNRDTLGLCVF